MIINLFKKITIVSTLLFVMYAPLTATTQRANAFLGDSASGSYLAFKESVLDNIAWALVDNTVKNMLRSTTAWINSGFKGKPLYVTDLSRFMTGVADSVAGEYISKSGLSYLCSPFQADILFALNIQYQATRNYGIQQCTLSGVVDNVDSFLEGDFIGGGGWDAWYAVTLTPQNNPYGALIQAQTVLDSKITSALKLKESEINRNRGFLDLVQCEDEVKKTNCRTVTPGSVIETQLNNTLGLSGDRLAVADEINEMIGAILNQLLTKTIGGKGGLRGTSDSYFNDTSNEPSQLSKEVAQVVDTYLGREKNYLSNETLALKIIDTKKANCSVLKKELSDSLGRQLMYITEEITTSKKHIEFIEGIQPRAISVAHALEELEKYTGQIIERNTTDLTVLRAEVAADDACKEK